MRVDNPRAARYLRSGLRRTLNPSSVACLQVLALLSLIVPSPPVAAEGTQAPPGGEVVRARWLMCTVLEIRLAGGTVGAEELTESAFAEVAKVEAAASRWRAGTELAEVHARAASGRPAVLSEILGDLVLESLRAAEMTGGAFSPAVGALVVSYDLRGEGRWPSDAERRRSASLARPDGVRYDAATRTLQRRRGSRSTSTASRRASLSTARPRCSGLGVSRTRS